MTEESVNIEIETILGQIGKLADQVSEAVERFDNLDRKVDGIVARLRESAPCHQKPRMADRFPDDEQLEKWEEEELVTAKNSFSAARDRLADAISGIEQFNCTYANPLPGGSETAADCEAAGSTGRAVPETDGTGQHFLP